MFNSKVIKVDSFVSSKTGKPFKVVWFSNEVGLPCKTFVSADFSANVGDSVKVSIQPSFDCSARVEVVKA